MSYEFIIWNFYYKLLWIPLSMIIIFTYIVLNILLIVIIIFTYMVFIHVNI